MSPPAQCGPYGDRSRDMVMGADDLVRDLRAGSNVYINANARRG